MSHRNRLEEDGAARPIIEGSPPEHRLAPLAARQAGVELSATTRRYAPTTTKCAVTRREVYWWRVRDSTLCADDVWLTACRLVDVLPYDVTLAIETRLDGPLPVTVILGRLPRRVPRRPIAGFAVLVSLATSTAHLACCALTSPSGRVSFPVR